MKAESILVVGSTGTVGSELIKQFAASGRRVKALVRDERKALSIKDIAEPVLGDLTRPETLRSAFKGSERVFVLAPPILEVEMLEKNAFEAALEGGAKRIVFLSNYGAGDFGTDYHFLAHAANERRVASLGIDWTILRPPRYMNYLPFVWTSVLRQNLLLEADGEGVMTTIAPADVAAVGLLALTTDGHEGQRYDITSEDSFTSLQLSKLLSKVLFRDLKLFEGDEKALRVALVQCGAPVDYAPLMAAYFSTVRAGNWKVTDTVSKLLGRKPLSYSQWLTRNIPNILETFG